MAFVGVFGDSSEGLPADGVLSSRLTRGGRAHVGQVHRHCLISTFKHSLSSKEQGRKSGKERGEDLPKITFELADLAMFCKASKVLMDIAAGEARISAACVYQGKDF